MADAIAVITTVGEASLADALANSETRIMGYLELGESQYDPTSSPSAGIERIALDTPFVPRRFVPVTFSQLTGSTIQVYSQYVNTDVFNVGEIGVWLGALDDTEMPSSMTSHTLLAVLSRPSSEGYLHEKASDVTLELEVFFQYAGVSSGAFVFPDASVNVLRLASELQTGSVRFATDAEWAAGTSITLVANIKRIKDSIRQGTELVSGFLRLANASQANGLNNTARAISPGRIPIASATQVGLMSSAHYTKIDATVIYTAAEQTKLAGIAAGAQVNRAIASEAAAQALSNNTAVITPRRVGSYHSHFHQAQDTDPTQAELNGMPDDGFLWIHDLDEYTP